MGQITNRLARLETNHDAERHAGMLVYEAPVDMTDEDAEAFLRSKVNELPGLVIRLNDYTGIATGLPRLVTYSRARSRRTHEQWVDYLRSEERAADGKH